MTRQCYYLKRASMIRTFQISLCIMSYFTVLFSTNSIKSTVYPLLDPRINHAPRCQPGGYMRYSYSAMLKCQLTELIIR